MSTLPARLAAAPPTPRHGWTPELKARFLGRLAVHGNARAACRNVCLSAEAAYKLRRRDPLFARGWAAALLLARENGIQVLAERAIEGVEEQIYYRGELVGTRRRYDNRLLLAHLARLDRLADEEAAGEDAGRFDEMLAAMAEGIEPLPDLETFVEAEGEAARERHRSDSLDAYYAAAEAADAARAQADADGLAADDEDCEADDDEFFDRLNDECWEEAERARTEAVQRWNRRKGEVFAVVDALDEQAARPAPHLPPALAALAAPASATGTSECGKPDGTFLPCTPSTVSTSALARALCGPAELAQPPLSPFTAPRKRGPGTSGGR